MRFVALCLVLFFVSPVLAQRFGNRYYTTPQVYRPPAAAPQAPPVVNRLDELKDGHDNYNHGEVADMPQGADRLYMTLVTSDDYQTDRGPRGEAQRKLISWFENDKRLIKYRTSTNWNWYTQSDPHFTGARTLANGQSSSLRARLGEAFPLLVIENSSGEAYFKMSGLSLPSNAGELADWITSSVKAKSSPPPRFAGQTEATPIVTEGAEQCPPDGCPQPNVSPVHPIDNSEVIDDTPRPITGTAGAAAFVLILCAVVAGCLVVLAVKTP